MSDRLEAADEVEVRARTEPILSSKPSEFGGMLRPDWRTFSQLLRPSVSPATRILRSAYSRLADWRRPAGQRKQALQSKLNEDLAHSGLRRLSPAEARTLAAQLRWRHAPVLFSDVTRVPERAQLTLVLAELELRAGSVLGATRLAWEAARHIDQLRLAGMVTERLRPSQRATQVFAELAAIEPDPKRVRELLRMAESFGPLTSDSWARLDHFLARSTVAASRFRPKAHAAHVRAGREDRAKAVGDRMRKQALDDTDADPRHTRDALSLLALANPGLSWPMVGLAKLDLDADRFDDAGAKLGSVFDGLVEPDRSRASFLLGQVDFYHKRYDDADKRFSEAEQGGVDVADIDEFRGVAKANIGALEAALDFFERAAGAKPDDAYLDLQLGNVLLCLGRHDEAGTRYRRALERDPGSSDCLFGLAKVAEVDGDTRAATDLYEQILAERSDHAPTLFARGAALLRLNETERARADFERVYLLVPDMPPNLTELGILIIRQALDGGGESGRGVDLLDRVIARGPAEPRVRYWRGRAYAAEGAFDACLDQWADLGDTEWGPTVERQGPIVRFYRAAASGFDGKVDEAIDEIGALADQLPEACPSREVLAHLHMMRAEAALIAGDAEAARSDVARVEELRPDDSRSGLLQALVAWSAGRLDGVDLPEVIGRVDDGPGRKGLRILEHARHQRLSPAEVTRPLWTDVPRDTAPRFLATSPLLVALDAVQALLASADAGIDLRGQRLDAVTEALADEQAARLFPSHSLGWWLGAEVTRAHPTAKWTEKWLAGGHDERPSALQVALGLVAAAAEEHELAVRILEGTAGTLPATLGGYVADVYAGLLFREVNGLQKSPQKMGKLMEHLETLETLQARTEGAA